jgi:hypothetical protein
MNNLDRDKNKHLKSFQDIKKKTPIVPFSPFSAVFEVCTLYFFSKTPRRQTTPNQSNSDD